MQLFYIFEFKFNSSITTTPLDTFYRTSPFLFLLLYLNLYLTTAKNINLQTHFVGFLQIKNIKAKLNQSSLLIITWDVDEKYANTPLHYNIKYKV